MMNILLEKQKRRDQYLKQHKIWQSWPRWGSKTCFNVHKDVVQNHHVHKCYDQLGLKATGSNIVPGIVRSNLTDWKKYLNKINKVRSWIFDGFIIIKCTSVLYYIQPRKVYWDTWNTVKRLFLTSCCKSLMIFVFFSISTFWNLIWGQKRQKKNHNHSSCEKLFQPLNKFNIDGGVLHMLM